MKSYILLKPEPVQSQIITIPAGTKPLVLFVGLDVHNDSIAVSLAPSESTEVRRYGIIGGEHDDVLKLVKKLQAAHPGADLEVLLTKPGRAGLRLCRCLRAHGLELHHRVSLEGAAQTGGTGQDRPAGCRPTGAAVPRGELTGIYVPEPDDEAMRDLIRARYQVGKAQHRARQQLKMYLLRHNLRYGGQTPWTPAHLRYLAKIKMPFAVQQIVFQEMLDVITRSHGAVGTLRPGDRAGRGGLALGAGGAGVDEPARAWRCCTPPRWWPSWATSTASSIPAS